MGGQQVGGITDPRLGGAGGDPHLSPDVGGGDGASATAETRQRAAAARAAIAAERAAPALSGWGPQTAELQAGPGGGFWQAWEGGSIYWLPATGACEVHGAIRERYVALGAERGVLGYPATNETGTPDGVGRYNHFERGSIYFHPRTGAHETHGAIRDKWAALGWERFGYPSSDEVDTVEHTGRVNHFQVVAPGAPNDGEERSIYWTPDLGAHAIQGPIRERWRELGWERSYLGYPTSDQQELQLALPTIPISVPGGIGYYNTFQRGRIVLRAGQPIEYPDTVTFPSGPISTPEPVGGWLEVTVDSKGRWRYNGHFHSSTALKEYDLVVAVALKAVDKSGRVVTPPPHHGKLPGGPADSDWDVSGLVASGWDDWEQVRTAGIAYRWDLTGDLTGPVKDLIAGLAWAGAALAYVLTGDGKTGAVECKGLDGGKEVILYREGEPPPECWEATWH